MRPRDKQSMRIRTNTGKRRFGISLLVATTLTGAGLAVWAPAASAAPPSSTSLTGSAPKWLRQAVQTGVPSGSTRVSATVVLAPRGGLAAAQQLAVAVSTPGSPKYRQFLTRAEYAARFDPTTATVTTVSALVRRAGFTVDSVAPDNGSVRVSGTVDAANAAFGAAMRRYRHDGQTVLAPSHDLRLPRQLAGAVLAVDGLDTTEQTMRPLSTNVAPPAGYRNSTLCSKAYGTSAAAKTAAGAALPTFNGKTLKFSVCGYTGKQLRTAYVKSSTLTGAGVGVAIVDAYASPTIVADTKTYASRHGDAAWKSGQYSQVEPAGYTNTGSSGCDASGWFGEETLDVEAVHAMAPGASVHYYAAASCSNGDLLAALTKAVNDPAVDIVSDSWGSSTELLASTSGYEKVFAKAAAVGVSVLFSSGDNGDEQAQLGFKTVGYPASSPNVTAVGGTATDINAAGALTAQTGWGTNKYVLSTDGKSWTSAGYLYGAGGGTSVVFTKPAYQASISGSGRRVPDLAMDADPTTGMLIGETQTFTDGTYYDEYRIGGTSLASPLLAGMLALSIQKAGKPAGFLNPTVYAKKSTTVKDVTTSFPDQGNVRADYTNGETAAGGYTYSVRTFDMDSSLKVAAGYDPVTGLGVPTTAFLSVLT